MSASSRQSQVELLATADRAIARADFAEAERCFRMLTSGARSDAAMVERYMDCLYGQYKIDTAIRFLTRRISKHRDASSLRVWRARFHVLAGDLAKAAGDLNAVLREHPEYTALHQNLGHVYRAFGELDKAAVHYAKAFAANPELADSYRLAAECTRQATLTPADEKLLSAVESGKQQHPDFCFGLANIVDRMGDIDRAWRLYERGNRLVLSRWPRNTAALIEGGTRLSRLIQGFSERYPNWSGPHRDQGVLVSGFPRSGTTMFESVIASDPRFWGCGELVSGGNAATRLLARLDIDGDQGRLTPQLVSDFGLHYLESQRRMVPKKRIGIDKATNQFRHSALLLLSCPALRMLQVKRDPRDLILSNFKARFTMKALAFAFSIPDLIAYLRFSLALMNQWQAMLPERVHTVSYDDYVHDSVRGNERLADFLDYGGEKPAFSFARKRQAVITVTSTQLGDQVRSDSSGKADAYAKHLEPWAKDIDALYDLL